MLFCPRCGNQHVDRVLDEPHKSHRCGACHTVWRASDEPTLGVGRLTTSGPEDTAYPVKPFVWCWTRCPRDEE